MSERKWTQQQNDAIYSRGGTLLLSAAAGSGKTAVLVERIIKLLTQGNEPVEPNELLVVTFTNAAAQEMRLRIANTVDELIKSDPTNNKYRNIKMKLPEAEISTIDSFCIKIVRENFHSANIEPDFKLLSSGENQILISEAMAKTLDTICCDYPDIYDMLNSMTSYVRDDSNLSGKIIKLYDFSLSHPFPDKWLDSIADMYNPCDDIKSTVWGKIIIDDACVLMEYAIDLVKNALEDIKYDEVIEEKYESAIKGGCDFLLQCEEIIKNENWDCIFDYINNNKFPSLPRAPRGYGDNPVKCSAEDKFKQAGKIYGSIANNICVNTKGFNEENEQQKDVVNALVSAVRLFSENYESLKKDRNSYTFADIMHRALKLIVKNDNGEIKKTTLAYSMESRYREILIDEYQDTNEAQDMLFYMLSKNGNNMFMVGDVKQSIYRFRLAMPEIFMKKSKDYHDYDGENYPAKIILGKNFRSRKGVLDNINFLFDRLMSENAGEMEYTSEDALYYGEGYDEDKQAATELHFLKTDNDNEEAEYVAKLIKEMLQNGTTVYDKGVLRKARPSDFCILIRSPNKKAQNYVNALKKVGIQCSSQKKSSLFDELEVNVFMSLLKVINNPTDDVSMLSVMFSPMYGFTPDEAVELKLDNKRQNMYSCLRKSNSAKAKKLVCDLSEYRRMSAIMPFDIFIHTLSDMTGYPAIVSAMSDGNIRKSNLMVLYSLASEYASNSSAGIDGFVRYISRIAEKGSDISSANDVSETADVVRIYSIHKSKGLEFPFVILADCSKKFNLRDATDDMIVNSQTGVGMVIINNEKLQKYPTIAHVASKIAVRNADISEELRVLYVAMTRAKERFIAISSDNKIEDTVVKICEEVPFERKPSAGAVLRANSYKNWFLMGFLNHPDMHIALTDVKNVDKIYKKVESRLLVKIVDIEKCQDEDDNQTNNDFDMNIIQELKKRCEYVYPYEIPDEARPKRVASEFENHIFKPEYFGKSKPTFILGDKLSAAEVGTANHLFLQNFDFNAKSVDDECKRMIENNILSQKQANSIRIDKVELFMTTELFSRIKNADAVYREKEFTVEISLGDIDSTVNENVKDEKIVVLGKADIVFVENGRATVVDYKTDRSKSRDEFITAYSGQLDMYRRAMEQVLEMPVDEALIYSLELGQVININPDVV